MSILIVTGVDDVHADKVIPLIEHSGAEVVRINTDNFSENAEFTLSSDGWAGEFRLKDSGRSFDPVSVSAVWYRKPVPVRAAHHYAFEQAREFANGEYEALLRSLYGLLDQAFWLSDYWRIRAAGQKLPNLRIAKEIGLRTPRTMVTTSETDARRFAEQCGWNLLAKPFALTTFKTEAETNTSWDSFAAPVDCETFAKLAHSLSKAPVLLQNYVDKLIELRVTIVGRRLFCTSISSQQHEFARHDWRAVDVEELSHEEFDLPLSVQEKLLAFNQRFGLEFSTHDLIVDRAGKFVWLECNPNGQWLWIEELTGQPIAQAVAQLLIDPADHALCR